MELERERHQVWLRTVARWLGESAFPTPALDTFLPSAIESQEFFRWQVRTDDPSGIRPLFFASVFDIDDFLQQIEPEA